MKSVNTINTLELAGCVGCEACVNICKVNAISMEENKQGFLYPHINEDLCVHCGRCLEVCQLKDALIPQKTDIQLFYSVKTQKDEDRALSKSGGVFYTIAEHILDHGGVVYGAVLTSCFEVVHKRIDRKTDIEELRNSKYVQSNVGLSYSNVVDDLKKGYTVLFSGTGCQCQALINLIHACNIDRSRLIVVDLVCHGVPSPAMFRSYINYMEKHKKSGIDKYIFRDKTRTGWGKEAESIYFADGKTFFSEKNFGVDFFSVVYRHELIRKSCFNCQYATTYRNADMTIGDFWGIEKSLKDFCDPLGVSLVIIHTEKGEACFNDCAASLKIHKVKREDCLQPNLIAPSKPCPETDEKWKLYQNAGIEALIKEEMPGVCRRIKVMMKRMLRKGINKNEN